MWKNPEAMSRISVNFWRIPWSNRWFPVPRNRNAEQGSNLQTGCLAIRKKSHRGNVRPDKECSPGLHSREVEQACFSRSKKFPDFHRNSPNDRQQSYGDPDTGPNKWCHAGSLVVTALLLW